MEPAPLSPMPDVKTGSSRPTRIIGLIFLILAPIVNYLAVVVADVGQRAETVETYISPANYAFQIWLIIFLGMIGYGIFQVQRERVESVWLKRASWGVLLAALGMCLFVPASFTGNSVLVFLDLLLILIPLIVAYAALGRQVDLEPSGWTRWAYGPVSVFLAWVSAATVVGTTQMLVDLGWVMEDPFAQWTAVVLIAVLGGLAGFFSWQGDGLFVLTVVWALTAIAVEQWEAPLVGYAAAIMAGILFVIFLYMVRQGWDGVLPYHKAAATEPLGQRRTDWAKS